jgi:hypothetical protein
MTRSVRRRPGDEDRGWIWRTIVDPQATEGEVLAAWGAATEAERRGILQELELHIAWDEMRQRGLPRPLGSGHHDPRRVDR